MNAIEAITTCYRKSFHKRGRASRSEFWWFALYYLVLEGVFDLLVQGRRSHAPPSLPVELLILAVGLFAIYSFFPFVSAEIRRLHDVGRSGWWLVAGMLMGALTEAALGVDVMSALATYRLRHFVRALISGGHWGLMLALIATAAIEIAVFIFLVLPGTAGDNRYGHDPLRAGRVKRDDPRFAGGH
ncbi:DUF805 domain-containing protein [Acidiferrobacter sp.]|jgi:uncharacterized membrane protein YhaH (DUF805 family)|uniref:DUF805 domain-containing protein n=1 Tax=Acidiferrobacter sp. TaxID=1872107 RepID=UPI0026094D56|nr:DUF805 domain-containing protein [Acidiferrobacter sp.]